MSIDAFLNKKYKLESSENFEEYLKAVGLNIMTRKIANSTYPVVELTKDGEKYTLTSTTTFKTVAFSFENETEFEQVTGDGRKVTAIIKIDGNTLQELQREMDGKESTVDRFFSEDELKMVIKYDDVICTRNYKPL